MTTEKVSIITEEIQKLEQEDEKLLNEMFSLKKKKKKDKEKKDKEKNEEQEKFDMKNYDPPTYTYQELLNRLFENIEDKEPTYIKNHLIMPIVHRIGSKKTCWLNFKNCCKSINKEEAIVKSFVINELTSDCNIDGNGNLLIKGIYNQKNIEMILRKFIINYVQCSICKSLETISRRDIASRLSFLDCLSCKSSRILSKITYINKK